MELIGMALAGILAFAITRDLRGLDAYLLAGLVLCGTASLLHWLRF